MDERNVSLDMLEEHLDEKLTALAEQEDRDTELDLIVHQSKDDLPRDAGETQPNKHEEKRNK